MGACILLRKQKIAEEEYVCECECELAQNFEVIDSLRTKGDYDEPAKVSEENSILAEYWKRRVCVCLSVRVWFIERRIKEEF